MTSVAIGRPRVRGITPFVPRRAIVKERGRLFPNKLYKLPERTEQGIGKLKCWKRIALPCGKAAASLTRLASFACAVMPVKFIQTAQK